MSPCHVVCLSLTAHALFFLRPESNMGCNVNDTLANSSKTKGRNSTQCGNCVLQWNPWPGPFVPIVQQERNASRQYLWDVRHLVHVYWPWREDPLQLDCVVHCYQSDGKGETQATFLIQLYANGTRTHSDFVRAEQKRGQRWSGVFVLGPSSWGRELIIMLIVQRLLHYLWAVHILRAVASLHKARPDTTNISPRHLGRLSFFHCNLRAN